METAIEIETQDSLVTFNALQEKSYLISCQDLCEVFEILPCLQAKLDFQFH